jgi:hypothetical protein
MEPPASRLFTADLRVTLPAMVGEGIPLLQASAGQSESSKRRTERINVPVGEFLRNSLAGFGETGLLPPGAERGSDSRP